MHAILCEFLTECSENDLEEIRVAYSPYIPSLASTKDGVRASIIFFSNAPVKDRRVSKYYE